MPAGLTTRRDHFQIMRGIACLMVFYGHINGLLWRGHEGTAPAWVEALVAPFGFPWVWFFLILSGFLLTKAFTTGRYRLTKNGVLGFYRARALRLLPALWFSSLLWFVLIELNFWSPDLPAASVTREIGVALAAPWAPYFQSTQVIASLNSPAWSAVIEVHFSIILPLVLLVIGPSAKRIGALLALWLVFIAYLTLSQPEIFPMIYGQHIYNLGFFMCGMLLATSPAPRITKSIPFSVAVAGAVFAMAVVQYVATANINMALIFSPIPMLVVLSLVVIKANDTYQATLPRTHSERLDALRSPLRLIELCGIMSYSIYLLHKPLAYIAANKMGAEAFVNGPTSVWVLGTIIFIILCPAFILSFICVEQKVRRWTPWVSYSGSTNPTHQNLPSSATHRDS